MRIKSWHMAVRNHRELIPKSVIGMHAHSPQPDPNMLDQMSKNITRQGITSSTLNYLRVSGDMNSFAQIDISIHIFHQGPIYYIQTHEMHG